MKSRRKPGKILSAAYVCLNGTDIKRNSKTMTYYDFLLIHSNSIKKTIVQVTLLVGLLGRKLRMEPPIVDSLETTIQYSFTKKQKFKIAKH